MPAIISGSRNEDRRGQTPAGRHERPDNESHESNRVRGDVPGVPQFKRSYEEAVPQLPIEVQERVIGRTKRDSLELADKPPDSHVSSTDQEIFGDIFRRNTPYGTVTDHGTMFVGFAAAQRPLTAMLESMAGLTTGARDALTRYTRPLTGAYYFVPSTEALRRLGDQPGA